MTHLQKAFEKLSQHSVQAVQTGNELNLYEAYLHVDLPIEYELLGKMDELDEAGGGIILLIGSAGDGKSHLIGRTKKMSDWPVTSFYNDATASSSPSKTAIDTLKEALVDFDDENLGSTNHKLILAINLGKLQAFIDDDEAKIRYRKIAKEVTSFFKDENHYNSSRESRIKIVSFTASHAFEFLVNDTSEYPVDSKLMTEILEKITRKDNELNPFYKAYTSDNSSLKN